MSNTFRTLIVPPSEIVAALLICEELGGGNVGMFTSTMREGPPPSIGTPDPRPIQGYISSGTLDDADPLLINDAAAMHAAILEVNPAATVTLAQCTGLVNYLDQTIDDPHERMAFMQGELNGIPVPTAWVAPTANGYPKDATAMYAGVAWRNLVEDNYLAPQAGSDGWRRVWS